MYSSAVVEYNAVYPCAYREHCGDKCDSDVGAGLSLCIQGTYEKDCIIRFGLRFIPVHTGNIFRHVELELDRPVYPCAYREH